MVKKKDTGKEPNIKYLFQGQCERSKHWFDIDIERLEVSFSTREPQFYKRPFQTNIQVQYVITYYIFTVPIGNTKKR